MKVGSLVVLEGNGETPHYPCMSISNTEIYTVTDLFKNYIAPYQDLITLSEKPIVFTQNGKKMGYDAARFREIQPPLDITALIEECKSETV